MNFVRHILPAAIVTICLGSTLPAAGDQSSPSPESIQQEILRAFDEGDYRRAQQLLEQRLHEEPHDYRACYNLACAMAMQGKVSASVEHLLDAISYGFVDFFHMERDSHLSALREDTDYRRIVSNWRKLLDARGAADMTALRAIFGDSYEYAADESMRINVASSFRSDPFEQICEELRRVDRWAYREVFPPAPGESNDRPDAWVAVIVPEPEDFMRLVRALGVGGVYDRDTKRLLAQDIGPSLRHEYFHVLHWRHMDRIGQTHPIWIMEGLSSLMEDVAVDSSSDFVLRPSWRTNIVKRLEQAGRLTPWREFFRLDRDRFMSYRSKANYAQARAILMFFHQAGHLKRWYEVYTQNFGEDPTGEIAAEHVFEQPLGQIEQRFRQWIRGLEEVAEIAHPGEVTIGVELSAGRGDGPIVDEIVHPRSAAGRAGLRQRDVILRVDDQPTPTLDEFHRVLGEFQSGDSVSFLIRRGTLTKSIELVLDARSQDQIFGPAVPNTP